MALAVVTLGSRQCCWNLALAVSEQQCYFNGFFSFSNAPSEWDRAGSSRHPATCGHNSLQETKEFRPWLKNIKINCFY